jgi:hypothetical protein
MTKALIAGVVALLCAAAPALADGRMGNQPYRSVYGDNGEEYRVLTGPGAIVGTPGRGGYVQVWSEETGWLVLVFDCAGHFYNSDVRGIAHHAAPNSVAAGIERMVCGR